MRLAPSRLALFAVAALAACGGKPKPEAPAPAPAPAPMVDSSAILRARQDSIDAANRARAEAEANAKAAAAAAAAAEAARIRDQLLATIAVPIHFDFDKSDIRPGDGDLLDQKAAILQANPGLALQIAGNADERGSTEYNLALGNRRAAAAKRYLMNKGIDGARLEVISYGEERPVNPAHNEAAWSENRRDDFVVTGGGDMLVKP
ncbi:MAG: OmpA family protein [Gemmatimonadales bacterium]